MKSYMAVTIGAVASSRLTWRRRGIPATYARRAPPAQASAATAASRSGQAVSAR
jgi:hypothetical protein